MHALTEVNITAKGLRLPKGQDLDEDTLFKQVTVKNWRIIDRDLMNIYHVLIFICFFNFSDQLFELPYLLQVSKTTLTTCLLFCYLLMYFSSSSIIFRSCPKLVPLNSFPQLHLPWPNFHLFYNLLLFHNWLLSIFGCPYYTCFCHRLSSHLSSTASSVSFWVWNLTHSPSKEAQVNHFC